MCNLLLGVNTKPDNEEFTNLIKAQYTDFDTMKDGIGAAVITFDNKLHIFRDFLDYDKVYAKVSALLPNAKIVSIHSRLGTSGVKSIGNVHFFKDGDYLLAHNGFVSGMSNYGKHWNKTITATSYCKGCKDAKTGVCRVHEDDDELMTMFKDILPDSQACDTLEFLRKLPKPVTTKTFGEFAEEKKMSGIAVLINTKTLEVNLMVEKLCNALSDQKTFGVFFSFIPTKTFQLKEWQYLFGVPVEVKGERQLFTHLENLPIGKGTYRVKYETIEG